MWTFANIQVDGVVVLGPMAGITSLSYRNFMKEKGIALSYSEMISDYGLIYENKETYKYLKTSETERPVGLQLFGGSKESLLKALMIVENSDTVYDFIDINLGCPVPKVTKTGAGSAWLKRPDELFEMMKVLVQVSKKPITAKIRIGWDEQSINVEEVVRGLEDAGVSLIAIHARTTKQLYMGTPHYELLKDFRLKMKVPLVISGDVFTLDDAIKALEWTKAEGVMVARGGLGNPRLVQQIDTYFKTGVRLPDSTLNERLDDLCAFVPMLIEEKGEATAISQIRGIGTHFLSGFSHMKPFKVKMTQLTTYADFLALIEEIRSVANSTEIEVKTTKNI